jgi:hypothetical protein
VVQMFLLCVLLVFGGKYGLALPDDGSCVIRNMSE